MICAGILRGCEVGLMPETPLTDDHAELLDTAIVRQYFTMFDGIMGYLPKVAAEFEVEGRFDRTEARILGGYVGQVAATFRALSYKYLMTGQALGTLAGHPTFDRHESGFPVAQELMVMANDAQQAEKHLAGMASEAELKDRMVRSIVGDLAVPVKLLSCRSNVGCPASVPSACPVIRYL